MEITLHDKELHDLYILAGIFRVTKLRDMNLAERIAFTREMKNMKGAPRSWWEDDIKMVLKGVSLMWTGSSCSG